MSSRVSSCHTEEVKGYLWNVKREMLMCGVHKDLQACWRAVGVLVVFERGQCGVDDSGSLLLWRRVCPAMRRQRRRVEEEIGWRHVDFNKLLLQKAKVFLETHRNGKVDIWNTKNLQWQTQTHLHRSCTYRDSSTIATFTMVPLNLSC